MPKITQEKKTCPFKLSFESISIELGRHFWDKNTRKKLINAFQKAKLDKKIEIIFKDNQLNSTENRAVTHVAWRDRKKLFAFSMGEKIFLEQEKMFAFADKLIQGHYRGTNGEPITDIVNVGIGGSHLGNKLVCEALKDFQHGKLNGHFLSNTDPASLKDLLGKINLNKTLWLFTSKSFATFETLVLLEEIKKQYQKNDFSAVESDKHFFAITSQIEKAKEKGFSEDKIFWFDEGVGGRFSLWSSVGLIILLLLGSENYQKLLDGAHAMDQHFHSAPLIENIPVNLAWLDYFYQNTCHAKSKLIVPYSTRLALLPDYLQQLYMESLGKNTHRDGSAVKGESGLVVWGGVGSDGQHAFHQFLYQNKQIIPTEFVAIKKSNDFQSLQNFQLLQCIAQAKALWEGTPDEKFAHKKTEAFNPSTLIFIDELNPYTLGSLLAMYEHSVFVLGELYDINAFDQFGVELGKKINNELNDFILNKDSREKLDDITRSILDELLS